MNSKSLLYEKARILMAYELKIPPDDIDLDFLLQSVFRGIRESCENGSKEVILTIKNEKEKAAILADYGQEIVKRIFSNQYPFDGIAEAYENWYIENILNKMDERENY